MKPNYFIDTDRHNLSTVVLKGSRLVLFFTDGTFTEYKITPTYNPKG